MVHYPTETLQSHMQRKPSKDELLINQLRLLCFDYQFRDERPVFRLKISIDKSHDANEK